MRLNEAEMARLLPSWMRQSGDNLGLAAGCDTIIRAAYMDLQMLSRWDKLDLLDEAQLDEMAWELNIRWYDSTAPISVKRALIRSSDLVYAKMGTRYAVEQVTRDYFGSGGVREWFEYGGRPHHFRVNIDLQDVLLGPEMIEEFRGIVKEVKRLSSWLDAIGTTTRLPESRVHIGGAAFEGIVSTRLPELTVDYGFHADVHAVPGGWNVMQTELPALEGPARVGKARAGRARVGYYNPLEEGTD